MRGLLPSVLFVSLAVGVCSAQVVSFDQIFPRTAHRQMGLHKLTTAEREALRSHVEALLARALASTSGSRERGAYPGVGGGHWIQDNARGRIITLEDGSLWEIAPLDRVEAMLWLPVSDIVVIESTSGSPGYGYLLVNTDDGGQAHARYIGR
ncbi:MAG: hypothetical protein OXF93_18340 [Acidobacteria bacterium]|nr:hypothetical protein [Acidobacteriota bacterium]